jgi:protein ERP2
VDVELTSPDKRQLYSEQRKQYDTYSFRSEKKGEYMFCFSNEFSTFAHKTVYFDFYTDEDDEAIPDAGAHHEALTQLETSLVAMHDTLKVVSDYQTHYRLRETYSRNLIEHVWERVQIWSLGEAVVIIVVSVGQVFVLRRFFPDRRSGI